MKDRGFVKAQQRTGNVGSGGGGGGGVPGSGTKSDAMQRYEDGVRTMDVYDALVKEGYGAYLDINDFKSPVYQIENEDPRNRYGINFQGSVQNAKPAN